MKSILNIIIFITFLAVFHLSCKTYPVTVDNVKYGSSETIYTKSIRKLKRHSIEDRRAKIIASITECTNYKVIGEGNREGGQNTTAEINSYSASVSTYTKNFYYITFSCPK